LAEIPEEIGFREQALIPVLCSQIYFLLHEVDRVIENLEKRVARLEKASFEAYPDSLRTYFSKELEKLQLLMDELLYVKRQASYVKSLVCTKESSIASLWKSRSILENLYIRYITGKIKLPGYIAPLLYQVYSTIKKI